MAKRFEATNPVMEIDGKFFQHVPATDIGDLRRTEEFNNSTTENPKRLVKILERIFTVEIMREDNYPRQRIISLNSLAREDAIDILLCLTMDTFQDMDIEWKIAMQAPGTDDPNVFYDRYIKAKDDLVILEGDNFADLHPEGSLQRSFCSWANGILEKRYRRWSGESNCLLSWDEILDRKLEQEDA